MADSRPPIDELWEKAKSLEWKTFRQIDRRRAKELAPGHKGRGGYFVEGYLGLAHNSKLLDFSDGELKTYSATGDGQPSCARMAIRQLKSEDIDTLLNVRIPFRATAIHAKTRQMIVVGICSEAESPLDWYVTEVRRVDARTGTTWFARLEQSYEEMREVFRGRIMSGIVDQAHYTSAGTYLQICGKDRKPYTPMHSSNLERQITTRRLGAYFCPSFLGRMLKESTPVIDQYGAVVLDQFDRVLLVEPANDAGGHLFGLPRRAAHHVGDPASGVKMAVLETAAVQTRIVANDPLVFDTEDSSCAYFLMRAIPPSLRKPDIGRSLCWAPWPRAKAILRRTGNGHDHNVLEAAHRAWSSAFLWERESKQGA